MAAHNRFTESPKFQALAGALSAQGQPAAPKQPARFSRRFYGLGASLKSGRSLASIGSVGGPFGVAFEALNRIGDDLLKQSFDERKKVAVETADREGLEETDAAFRENRMVLLRQDETISAQAFNKSVQTAYLTRLDTNIDGVSSLSKAKHPNDPAKFSQAFDVDANKLLGLIPPEWLATVRMELIKRKGRAVNEINVAAVVEEQGRNNSELITGMDQSSAKWLEAIRQSYRIDEADPAHAQVLTDIAENRGKFVGALDGIFGMTPAAKAEAMARAEKNARFEHVLGAFGEASRAGQGEKFIAEFAKSGLEDDNIETDERRKLVKTLNAEFTKGREQEILVAAQSIADAAIVDFDNEAEAVADARKRLKGDLETKAVAQIKGRFADQAKAIKANDEALWTTLEAAAADGATAAQLGEVRNQGSTRSVRKAMGEYITKKTARQEPETDFEALYDYRQMEPEERVKIDLFSEFRNKLNDTDFKQAMALQEADKAALGKAEMTPAHAATLTFTQRVNIALQEAGLTGKGPNVKKRAAKFTTEAARQIHRFEVSELEGKRKATGDEIQKIVNEMIDNKVTIDDSWFGADTQLPAAAVSDKDFKEGISVSIDDIDAAAVKKARAALARYDLAATDDQVEELVAAQRMNGLQGVTEWFRSKGATGPVAMTDEEKRRSLLQQKTSGVSR